MQTYTLCLLAAALATAMANRRVLFNETHHRCRLPLVNSHKNSSHVEVFEYTGRAWSCMYLSLAPESYLRSRQRCHVLGGHKYAIDTVTVKERAKNEFLVQSLRESTQTPDGGVAAVWIGLTWTYWSDVRRWEWRWRDGQRLRDSHNVGDIPRPRPDSQVCAFVSAHELTWRFDSCITPSLGGVCEWQGGVLQQETQPLSSESPVVLGPQRNEHYSHVYMGLGTAAFVLLVVIIVIVGVALMARIWVRKVAGEALTDLNKG